jgi:hypothetical protein
MLLRAVVRDTIRDRNVCRKMQIMYPLREAVYPEVHVEALGCTL